MKKIIATERAPAAIGPYSQAVAAGGFLFVSGQLPLKADGARVAGGIEDEAVAVLENLKAVLEAAGYGLEDVVKTTVYLWDLDDYPAFNRVYSDYFVSRPPARAAFQVAALPKGARVELEAVAWRGDE